MNQHSEYSQVARDPERRDKIVKALPLVIAALISLPLVWLSLRFSLMVGQIAYYVVLMGTSTLNVLGLGIMTLLGFASYLLGVAVMLVGLALWLELLAASDACPPYGPDEPPECPAPPGFQVVPWGTVAGVHPGGAP